MEIDLNKQIQQQKKCQACTKNHQLILKYQNLITLLKKKADRSHLSHSNKHSVGDLTTSNSSFNTNNFINLTKLPLLLFRLQQRLKTSAFYQIKSLVEIKKCLNARQFLNKIQKLLQNKERQIMTQIKLSLIQNQDLINQQCHQSSNICPNLIQNLNPVNITMHKSLSMQRAPGNETQIFRSNKKSKFSQEQNSINTDYLNYKSLAYVHQDFINSTNLSQAPNFKEQSIRSMTIKDSSNLQLKNLYKKIFVLQQQIFSYQNKIKNLETNMQEALARQIKQSTKKTESLQMVAEQMAQKNQLISELNEKIIMLQEKYRCQANGILQDELTQHRKQVQKLQKINIKYQNQLRRVKESLASTQSLLHERQKQKNLYQNQISLLKQRLFDTQHKMGWFDKRKQSLAISCKKIENILQKLRHYEKVFFSQLKFKTHNKNQIDLKQKQEMEESYKLQLIFIYLYNIEDDKYDFKEHQHLFDEQQLEVLKQFKEKFKGLKNSSTNKIDLMETIQCAEYGMKEAKVRRFENQDHNFSSNHQVQNIYCHQNLVDGSIFDVLNDHRQNNSRIQELPSKTQRIDPEKNLTMKLLQMQIQKNKQIQKISQLKQKNMYIRNIILNLIKSLQLRQNTLKNQTTGILQLIFDVFQYSQEEKNLIFTNVQQQKEKRFFGFI